MLILGTVPDSKAEQSLNSLKELSAPLAAKVLRDSNVIQFQIKRVTIGDKFFWKQEIMFQLMDVF